MKQLTYLGLLSGILAGAFGWLFVVLYQQATASNFTMVLNFQSVVGASLVGCLLMSLGANIWFKLFESTREGWLNLIYLLLSLMTFAGPLLSDLPKDVTHPELFPGAALPLHLFPLVFWLSIKPFFNLTASDDH